MKGISNVVVTSLVTALVEELDYVRLVLSLSQFTESSALTFLALIGFLLHVTLHFPLEGGCRKSTSFSGLPREQGFLLGRAV